MPTTPRKQRRKLAGFGWLSQTETLIKTDTGSGARSRKQKEQEAKGTHQPRYIHIAKNGRERKLE